MVRIYKKHVRVTNNGGKWLSAHITINGVFYTRDGVVNILIYLLRAPP